MDNEISRTRNVITIIISALALGIIFDYLFSEKLIGVSVLVFALVLMGVLWLLSERFEASYKSSIYFGIAILFFAAMPAIRANLFLNFLNILAIIGLLLLMTRELLQEHVASFKIIDYVKTIFLVPLKMLLSAVRPLRFGLDRFRQTSSSPWRRVLIGIGMALPVLIIFTLLFSSADLAFKQFINQVFNIHVSEEFFGHMIIIVMISIASLGALEYVFKPAGTAATALEVTPTKETSGREVEVQVFLYLIVALFAIFISFQLTYLFGGDVNITNRGFTYAEYARRGFWELLVVASATLVILLFVDSNTRRSVSRKKWFTIPSSIIILEIFVIIISALKRLILYQDAYGMTDLRFYVSAFILFLGVIFVLLATKFIFEKRENFFAFGSLLTMITFLVGINLINPDSYIARKNIEQFHQTGRVDVNYLTSLSADAWPQILEILPRLNPEDRSIVEEALEIRKEELNESRDWQSYNISRHKVLEELQKH